jgi:hypothetical protein
MDQRQGKSIYTTEQSGQKTRLRKKVRQLRLFMVISNAGKWPRLPGTSPHLEGGKRKYSVCLLILEFWLLLKKKEGMCNA